MKEELALQHLLLRQAQELAHRAARAPEQALLRQLGEALTVTYDRTHRRFLVAARLDGRELQATAERSEFRFYRRHVERPGAEPAPADQGPSGDPAPAEHHNRDRARHLLLELLGPAGARLADSEAEPAPAGSSRRTALWCLLLVALLSGALTWYQGTRTFNLIDGTYTLEVAWRLSNGEVPYRDFTLVVVPGIYVKQAVLHRLFGHAAIVGLWWCVFAMAATVLLTFIVLRQIDTPRGLAVVLCLVPAVGGNVVRPYVWYDVDAVLLVLSSIGFLLWAERRSGALRHLFCAGFLAVLPLLFKQNLGLAHLAAVTLIVYARWLLLSPSFTWRRCGAYHLGVFAGLLVLVMPFWLLGALPALVHDTVVLAGTLRISMSPLVLLLGYSPLGPGLAKVLGPPWPGVGWTVDFFCSSLLLWGSAAALGSTLLLGIHRSVVRLLLPLWIGAVGLAGLFALGEASVYPLLPLLAILLALLHAAADRVVSVRRHASAVVGGAAVALAASLLAHALSGRELSFYREPFGEVAGFRSERLRGMAASARDARGLDELVVFVDALPAGDTVALTPTEEPIYFLTGRRSPLRIVQRLKQSGGDPSRVFLPEIIRVRPVWVFEKSSPQFLHWQPLTRGERSFLEQNYRELGRLSLYRVWRRNDPADSGAHTR